MRKLVSLAVAPFAMVFPSIASAADNADDRREVQVYFSETCLLNQPPEAELVGFGAVLASALIGATVDTGLSLFSTTLRSASEKKVTTYSGNRVISLFERANGKIDPLPLDATSKVEQVDLKESGSKLELVKTLGCVLVVAGRFEKEKSVDRFGQVTLTSPGAWDGTNLSKRLRAMGIPIEDAPDIVYEAMLKGTPQREAFVLQSTFLNVGKWRSTTSSSARRQFGMTLAFDEPRTGADAATLRVVTLDFGKLKPGTTLKFGEFAQGAQSVLVRNFVPNEGAKELLKRVGDLEAEIAAGRREIESTRLTIADTNEEIRSAKPDDRAALEAKRNQLKRTLDRARVKDAELFQRWFDLVDARGDIEKRLPIEYMPVEVTASLIETRDANAFLKFLADVFDKAKDGVGTAIKDEIDPVKINERREADVAEVIANEEALSKALVAYLNAKKAYLTVDPKNAIDLEIAYENYLAALRALNRARDASDLGPLAPEALAR